MLKWLKSLLKSGNQEMTKPNGRYILIVEDGGVERAFYTKTLEKAGYEVASACDAFEAIKMIEKRIPDIILSDVSMPHMSGKEMCLKLKADDRTANIPIVFLTGSVRPMEVMDCFDVGAEHYLEKPIDAKCLVRQMDMI